MKMKWKMVAVILAGLLVTACESSEKKEKKAADAEFRKLISNGTQDFRGPWDAHPTVKPWDENKKPPKGNSHV